ncbi:MAG TPA: sugar phosphate isomerase/epimerase family protein [Acidisarcina sp.]|nr:sugar phosphate isomerase/epimerase family protein [Acidisarcina sp.]
MLRVISTHVFLRQRLHPGLLDQLTRGGAQAIEIFAARQHFNYTDRAQVREISEWFRSNPVHAFSLHAPVFPDLEMGRDGVPSVNVVHPDKSRRIDAMDEIKRALETAEQLPLDYMILHLGDREDAWNPRTLEHSLTALEHLQAFARPLGVGLLVENLQNEVTAPANNLEILATGHFDDIGVCLDLGHAHLGEGIPAVIGTLKERIRSAHIHDNLGDKDSHLWPGEGNIDWTEAMRELRTIPRLEATVLEINYTLGDPPEAVSTRAAEAFRLLEL